MSKGVYVRTEKTKKSLRLNRLGCKDSEETRIKKCIAKCKENHPSWKGGISLGEKRKAYFINWHKEYYVKNILDLREKSRLRMLNRRSKEGKITKKVIQLLYEDNIKKYGTLTCYLCMNPITFGNDCIEHKTPICRNGTNLYENLGISHKSCNSAKRSKTEEEYRVLQFKI